MTETEIEEQPQTPAEVVTEKTPEHEFTTLIQPEIPQEIVSESEPISEPEPAVEAIPESQELSQETTPEPQTTPEPPIVELPHEEKETPQQQEEPEPPQKKESPKKTSQSRLSALLDKAREALDFRTRARHQKIMEFARKNGSVSNDEVEKLLRVSDSTAARYLGTLARQGKLSREKGGRSTVYQS